MTHKSQAPSVDLLPENASAAAHACSNHINFSPDDQRHCLSTQADVMVNVGSGELLPYCGACAGELAVMVAGMFVFLQQQNLA